jgi:hypothetical protein
MDLTSDSSRSKIRAMNLLSRLFIVMGLLSAACVTDLPEPFTGVYPTELPCRERASTGTLTGDVPPDLGQVEVCSMDVVSWPVPVDWTSMRPEYVLIWAAGIGTLELGLRSIDIRTGLSTDIGTWRTGTDIRTVAWMEIPPESMTALNGADPPHLVIDLNVLAGCHVLTAIETRWSERNGSCR